MNKMLPLSNDHGSCSRLVLKVILMLGCSLEAHGYDRDIHYYVTAMIMADLGGGAKISNSRLAAALSNQYVDDNPNTLPSFNPFDVKQRRTFHFPAHYEYSLENIPPFDLVKGDIYDPTQRNSPFAKHNVNWALKTNDSMLLGMALHTYMDSYTHEGYAAVFGHATAGHDPDRPHLSIDKFREMVRMVYSIGQKWYKNNGQSAQPQTISLDQYRDWAKFTPKYDLFADYEKSEIIPREEEWKKHIAAKFPNAGIPTYYQLFGEAKRAFEAKARGYSVPDNANQCLADEWRDRESGDIINPLSFIADDTQSDINVAELHSQQITHDFSKWNTGRLAKYVLEHPESFLEDDIHIKLSTRKGTAALMHFVHASQQDYTYPMKEFNSEVNWDNYNEVFSAYLSASKLRTRLLAASILSNNHPNPKLCKKLNAFWGRINVQKLNPKQRQLVLSSINPNSAHIATCAPNSFTVLEQLFGAREVSAMAAAMLYLIGADEDREIEVTDDTTRNAMREIRQAALVALRQGVQDNNVMATATADHAVNEINYWQARSYEDADDQSFASGSDLLSMERLRILLKTARETQNLPLGSAVASALGTFEPEDQPSQELLYEISLALADPLLKDIRLELAYALESVTGKTMDLSTFW